MVRLQGRVRSVRHAARRRRDQEADVASRAELQELENALPIDPKYRNPKLGALAPIRVVNVVFTAGDGNRGVQTAAFNLPNDDRVIKEKGSKRVMLKNVQEAKFQKALVPIAAVALAAADRAKVSFDAFFTHILMHELMHGLGPQQVHGTTAGLRQALKDTCSALEEAKADISGLWALQRLADEGAVSPEIARTMYTTFPGVDVPFDSLRPERGARQGHRAADQLAARSGRRCRQRRRHVLVVDAKIKDAVANLASADHDDPGRGQLRRREGAAGENGGDSAGGAARARQAQGRARGHRAAVHLGAVVLRLGS